MLNMDMIEKAFLIGIVREKKWQIVILNNLSAKHFSFENREIFNYIKEFTDKNEYPDLPLLAYKFQFTDEDMVELREVGELENLCNEIKNNYLQELTVNKLGDLNTKFTNHELEKDPIKFVNDIGSIYKELQLESYEHKTVNLFDNLDAILKIDPTNVISTGFKELDEKLVGWKRGEELVVFFARTGNGKSWLGLKFALSAALNGEKVGIYSGEMSQQQLQDRIICCGKKTYTTTREESVEFLKSKNIDIRLLTQTQLRRRANVDDLEAMIVRDNLTLLIVDQLSLVEDNTCKPGTPLRQQYGNISMDLFTLSSKYNLPVILLAQSNRQGGQELYGPTLENLAESDAVGQNATRVISMKNENGVMYLNIVKNRYGESGATIKFEVDFAINKYKVIRDQLTEVTAVRKNKAKSIFGNGGSNPF